MCRPRPCLEAPATAILVLPLGWVSPPVVELVEAEELSPWVELVVQLLLLEIRSVVQVQLGTLSVVVVVVVVLLVAGGSKPSLLGLDTKTTTKKVVTKITPTQ